MEMYLGLLMFTLFISNSFNLGVNTVLLAHNYHIIGSFVCRDQNMIDQPDVEDTFHKLRAKDFAFRRFKMPFQILNAICN